MKIISICKATLSVAFFSLLTLNATAQDDDVKKFVDSQKELTGKVAGWLKGGFINTNLTNVGLSNWAAGGQNSLSVAVNANLFAIYKKNSVTWETYFDAAWGSMRNGEAKLPDGSKNPFLKNEDKLTLLSKYGRRINSKLNYTALLEFKSQSFPGYSEYDPSKGSQGQHISNFVAPAFGLLSVGLDYKPKDYLSFYLSPVTGKFTIVNEQRLADLGLYGVTPAEIDPVTTEILKHGQKFRSELGWYINIMFNRDVMENVNVKSRLDLFTNYKTLNKTDVNWETTINMKINKYITASIFTHLIYDDDIDVFPETPLVNPRIQFKHVVGIGFSYMFGDRL